MRRLVFLFVLSVMVACSHAEKRRSPQPLPQSQPQAQQFTRDQQQYEHFILGSNAPEEQEKIDATVAANADQEATKLSHADRGVVDEILLAINAGKAKEYEVMDYARRITNPEASVFWGEVLRVAAVNQTFPMCLEREMQLALDGLMGYKTFEPGSEVRAACDSDVAQRLEEHPELWRVRNEMLWSCAIRHDKSDANDKNAELTAKAQAYLKGKQIGAHDCK